MLVHNILIALLILVPGGTEFFSIDGESPEKRSLDDHENVRTATGVDIGYSSESASRGGTEFFRIDGENSEKRSVEDNENVRTAVHIGYSSEYASRGGTEFFRIDGENSEKRSVEDNENVRTAVHIGYSSEYASRALFIRLPDRCIETENIFLSRHLLNDASNTSKKNTTTKTHPSLNLAEKISFTVGYILCFVIGFTGDLLILITIKRTKELHTDLNYLLCNIAIADIFRMITMFSYELFMILAIGNATDSIPSFPGIAGDILCKAMWSLPNLFSYGFVFTLVCMTAERFVAVAFPFRIAIFKGKTKWFILGVWLAAIVLVLPFIYASKSFPSGCYVDFTPFSSSKSAVSQYKMYLDVMLADAILVYVIPVILILSMHAAIAYVILRRPTDVLSTQRTTTPAMRRVISMLGTMTLVFMLTWMPNKVYLFLYIYQNDWMHGTLPVYFTFLIFFIAALSSMLNPWIYPFYVNRFRKEYVKLLRRCFPSKKERYHSQLSETSSNTNHHTLHTQLVTEKQENETVL